MICHDKPCDGLIYHHIFQTSSNNNKKLVKNSKSKKIICCQAQKFWRFSIEIAIFIPKLSRLYAVRCYKDHYTRGQCLTSLNSKKISILENTKSKIIKRASCPIQINKKNCLENPPFFTFLNSNEKIIPKKSVDRRKKK